ncbi:MAG: hypothetical protein Q4B77_04180 [Coriobacteriaceae bacterium]|nr:hypothetical protein [Coriobacteriaceae bacterium]
MGEKNAWNSSVSARLNEELQRARELNTLYFPTTQKDLKALQRRQAAGEVVEPRRNLFTLPGAWNDLSPQARHLCILHGLQAQHASWIFSNQSAAIAHGLPVAAWNLSDEHIAIGKHGTVAKRPHLIAHRTDPIHPTRTLGIRCTDATQTVLDCSRTLPFGEGLAITDAALRYGLVSPSELKCLLQTEGAHRTGIARARAVAQYADGRSESWGESQVRAQCIALGFALPDLQVEIDLPSELGGTKRVDFLWILPDGSYLIGEYDGMGKYQTREDIGNRGIRALVEERQRESRLSILRAPILRLTYPDVKDPLRFAQLLDAFGVPHARRANPTLVNDPLNM